MNITVMLGEEKYISDCIQALMESDLGAEFFPNEIKASEVIYEALKKKMLYVAIDNNNNCYGFMYAVPKGAFQTYPYLHLLAVKDAYRGQGIGKIMLNYFENNVQENASKVFLLVDDFNIRAKNLYEKIGYKQVGIIPDLFKKDNSSYLMMKQM